MLPKLGLVERDGDLFGGVPLGSGSPLIGLPDGGRGSLGAWSLSFGSSGVIVGRSHEALAILKKIARMGVACAWVSEPSGSRTHLDEMQSLPKALGQAL